MDIVFKKDGREIRLQDFLVFLTEKCNGYTGRTGILPPDAYSAEIGRKYIKIVVNRYGNSEHRSVYCFLDMDGNIFKAASWKIPAKHKRGSIFDPDYSWGKGLGPYGASYMR